MLLEYYNGSAGVTSAPPILTSPRLERAMADFLVPTERQIRNFWAKVDKSSGPEGCWIWTGKGDRYGSVKLAIGDLIYKSVPATHVSLVISGRPRPFEGAQACHGDTCTTTLCVNDAHLRWGTAASNSADRDRLGRNAFGVRQHLAKLDDAKVADILISDLPHQWLAEEYGVTRPAIQSIRSNKTWKHVPRPAVMPVIRYQRRASK